ncbi:hypothetical protein ATCM_02405 [Stenotrophomonas sp. ATCM1_4]|uniref:hypothetical protein n=1 Tax=Stenotrophomonas sp. ATCM1_4 TaxID=2259330 RepID=UPI00104A6309|nr:hypothetical protein [Stenotrophomonas sp. ATCM1_4]TDB26598.1 hypothetical protein ATCM_02405 [Stenotrophomonas sp. ATCM1_4]
MSQTAWGSRLLWATGVFTALAIAAGVWVIDSPAQQRLLRLDESRLQDLRSLEQAARSYRTAHEALPPDMARLRATPGLDLPLHDPAGGPDYRYRLLDDNHFELCALFATDSARQRRFGGLEADWAHPAGEHCFRRSIKNDED